MNKKLHETLSEFHNSKPIELRRVMCISSMSTQITTLIQMKNQIMVDAEKRCKEIDEWIRNIERGVPALLRKIEEDGVYDK